MQTGTQQKFVVIVVKNSKVTGSDTLPESIIRHLKLNGMDFLL